MLIIKDNILRHQTTIRRTSDRQKFNMTEVHRLQPREPHHIRHRLPNRTKAKLHDGQDPSPKRSATSNKNINIFRVSPPGASSPEDNKSDTAESVKTKTFEFVTITSRPSTLNRNETSKRVRTQAMRDYLRKQNKEAITGVPEVVSPLALEEPSRYKGRFKLNTWTRKVQKKSTNARNTKSQDVKEGIVGQELISLSRGAPSSGERGDAEWRAARPLQLPDPVFSRLDPFDSLAIQLKPHSETLLIHYMTTYRMNSVAVNAEGDFFSYVKSDVALFHCILYLVALNYDLKIGIQDSPICLFHGGEAFRIINERIADSNGVYNDQTIGAVAMLVNKENLNGRYELSQVHMQGLEWMIWMRGGISSLKGVFRRIVTWCDFCHSTVRDTAPLFPRIPPTSPPTTASMPSPLPDLEIQVQNQLSPSTIFDSSSPMFPIITALRSLSSSLDPKNISTLNRLQASTQIYNLEYDILLLNSSNLNQEAIPLKVAAQLYLWLVIREVPPSSPILSTLIFRLQSSLLNSMSWWYAESDSKTERKIWLFWILFVGAVASLGRVERFWFIQELEKLCLELGVSRVEGNGGLRDTLLSVALQELFFGWHLVAVWEDITALLDLGMPYEHEELESSEGLGVEDRGLEKIS